jgi:predicted methyltransferase
MHSRLISLAMIGAMLTAAPLSAKPQDYAYAVTDKARSEANRKLDESRLPAQVLDFTGVSKGQSVGDLMAGGGYFTELFARVVGPKGTVYALEPASFHDPKVWQAITAKRPNVRVLVKPVAEMKLAPGSLDLLFTSLNYHDLYWQSEKFKFPRLDVPAVLADWFAAVRPGGHVVIIDHAGPAGDPRAVVEKLHRIDPAQVKADMAAAGFVLVAESDMLRRSEDDHTKNVFDPAIRGKTDRFVLKFRRP